LLVNKYGAKVTVRRLLYIHLLPYCTSNRFTGPSTNSVCGRLVTVADVLCRRICNVNHQRAARAGSQVVLRHVRATHCLHNSFIMHLLFNSSI